MNNLATFPTSIQSRLEEAKSLLAQNKPADASAMLISTCVELAKTSPELAAFVIALAHGFPCLTLTETQRTSAIEQLDRIFLGHRMTPKLVGVSSERTIERTWKVSR
ncbi:MAG TPA: hypothetical protein PKA27_13685 [Fimbriimonadaceae bacterium]|nr:hypothetical protein [Fimbriimonadaceae bacterium]